MELNNHIGIFENAFSPAECGRLISMFHNYKAMGTTRTRVESQKALSHTVNDQTLFMFDEVVVLGSLPDLSLVNARIWDAYDAYTAHYSTLRALPQQVIYSMRLQRTVPGEGYHTWHHERTGKEMMSRMATFILYLNDVTEGGETEFLHFPLRVKPKQGTLIIWPATYTHTHRGNPPLAGEKFILTGWIDVA